MLLTPLLLLLPMTAPAQNPAPRDPAAAAAPSGPLGPEFLREYAETRGYLLGRPQKFKFTPDGRQVLFLRSEAKQSRLSLYAYDLARKEAKVLLTPEAVLQGAEENLTPEEKARRERMRLSAGGFSDYQLSEDGAQVLLPLSGRLYLFERATGKVRELQTSRGTLLDPRLSPDGSKVAYVLNADLCVYDLAQDRERPLTRGGSERKTYGLAEFVAQEEMGRFSGYWWSPDSKSIAYQEADHEGVEQWFVADPTRPQQPPLPQYYPRPGRKNVRVRLGVTPVTGGDTAWVNWDRERYEYLAAVRWDATGVLTIQLQDRKQQLLTLFRVDPATGGLKELFREADPAWVNLKQNHPVWLPGGAEYLFSQTHQGSEVPHLRRTDGTALPLWPEGTPLPAAVEMLSYDAGRRQLWFQADAVNGLPRLGVLQLDEKGTRVTGGLRDGLAAGVRGVAFAKDHSHLVVTRSTLAELPRSVVLNDRLEEVGEIPSVAMTPSFTPRAKPEVVLKDYSCMVVRPHGFDAAKKYPVIVDVYGGPHHVHVQHALRNWLLPQWLADRGFIVVAIDNRGIPGKGRDWERSVYQKFGSVPLEGQVEALKELGRLHPEMDLGRVGVVGWSFGGYMSALAVLKRPDVFHAAVAGAPVTDWEDYDTHYTERYMGLLPEAKAAYAEGSLLPLAPRLSRPLLLVHGTADDNVYFRHTLRLTDALFRAGRDFEVLPLPGLTHMVPDPEVTERLWSRIARHFERHLQR